MSPLSEKDKAALRALIAESVSSGLSPDDQGKLEAILRDSRAAKEYYIECLGLYTDLHDLAGSQDAFDLPQADSGTRVPRSRRLRFASAASIAALLLLGFWFLWPRIAPGPEIGTVVDALDLRASWSFPKRPGQRLHLRQAKARIKAGVAHIHLDQGVDLILEAPCSFEVVSPTVLTLKRGRLYARVAEEGRGFTVKTSEAEIVDLGTEFGVVSYGAQGAEVHVMVGRVEVHEASPRTGFLPESIVTGHALQISARGDVARDVPYDPGAFVRRIDSTSRVTWRGQNALDLADVVAGGDGFGTGRPGYEIEPLTGSFRAIKTEAYDRQGDHRYHPVEALPFVDGVFVPDGGAGPVQVTSAGHEFADCPETCNIFFSELLGCSMALKGEIEGQRRGLILNGVEYANDKRSGIFMHANLGVTFDLQRVREALGPALTLQRFESMVGISEATNVPEVGDVDVWVLLDGRVAYVRRDVKVGRAQPVDIPIDPEARFLTLAATDSRSDNEGFVDTFADWCTFGQPRLILRSNAITSDPDIGR